MTTLLQSTTSSNPEALHHVRQVFFLSTDSFSFKALPLDQPFYTSWVKSVFFRFFNQSILSIPILLLFRSGSCYIEPRGSHRLIYQRKLLKHLKKIMLLCLVDLDQEELLHLLQLRCLLPRPLSLLVGNLQHFSLIHIFKKKQIFDRPQFSTSGSYNTWQSC